LFGSNSGVMTLTDGKIRVVVVDDHAVVREGIRRVLESDPGMSIVGEGGNADEALALVQREKPDVLLVDVAMPGRTGLQVAAELRQLRLATRVLVLSMYDQPEYILESVRAGARGYLLKDSPPAELRRAIRAVHGGEGFFPPAVAARLEEARRAPPRTSPLDVLTPRERDVLLGITRGETNKEVAQRLGISHRTVETHRESLMNKLQIRTVAGLTKLVIEEGLLEEEEPRR
jgi:DNA-binding NarL/FixJ family response regulator